MKVFFEFLIAALVYSLLVFSTTVFSRNVIDTIQDKMVKKDDQYFRILILNFLGISFLVPSGVILGRYYLFKANRLSLNIRSAILWMVQKKILKFGVLNSTEFSEGNITNLLQVDVKRVADMAAQIYVVIQQICYFTVGTSYMFYLGGRNLGLLFLSTFLSFYVVYIVFFFLRGILTRQLLVLKDSRMSYFRNVLQNIQYVKIKALENFYSYKLFQKREKEIRKLKQTILMIACSALLDMMAPTLATFSIIFYLNYMASPNQYITSGSFVAFIQISDMIKDPLYIAINNINFLVECRVSIRRLNLFLNAIEPKQGNVTEIETSDTNDHQLGGKEPQETVLKITNGNFYWKNEILKKKQKSKKKKLKKDKVEYQRQAEDNKNAEEVQLNHQKNNSYLMHELNENGEKIYKNCFLMGINLEVFRGERIIVFGEGGSGKSSLLYCMLGEMIPETRASKIEKRGKIAFMAQERWMIGDTIKENITMGKEFDQSRMNKCLETSMLVHDLKILNEGLETVLGDTSDTVSGGQKARIALARCFYVK